MNRKVSLADQLAGPRPRRRVRPAPPRQVRRLAAQLVAARPRCIDCGTTENLNRHHVLPVRFGGSDDPKNLVWVCDKHHPRRELISRLLAKRLGLRDLYASALLKAALRRHRPRETVAPAPRTF